MKPAAIVETGRPAFSRAFWQDEGKEGVMGLFDKIVSMVGESLSGGTENKGLMERFRKGVSRRGDDRLR